MTPPRKVIITCAITGAIHTPTMSPHLPINAEEIAQSAIGAAKAGAAIVHLHAPITWMDGPRKTRRRFSNSSRRSNRRRMSSSTSPAVARQP